VRETKRETRYVATLSQPQQNKKERSRRRRKGSVDAARARARKMNAGVLSCNPIGAAREEPWLHVRRELFEYGILPYPSLMHNDVVSGLRNLRDRLLLFQQASPICTWSLNNNSSSSSIQNGESDAVQTVEESSTGRQKRVATAAIAASLELSEAHAHLVLDTLASILPDEGEEGVDRLARTPLKEIDSVGADVDDVLLYLYVQSYRRVPSRPHRDAAAVADVWPSTSAIDRLLPSPSPLQVAPLNPNTFCPSSLL
jgi:TBCC domain-containing protein 1